MKYWVADDLFSVDPLEIGPAVNYLSAAANTIECETIIPEGGITLNA
jgi:hypothetical protein